MDQSTSSTTTADDDGPLHHRRDCTNLYAPCTTLRCALKDKCVPCAYKIAAFDIALDTEFVKKCPNQRPELCPRSKRSSTTSSDLDNVTITVAAGYSLGMSCLTVGDGDFSFSLAIARMLLSNAAKGSACRRGHSGSNGNNDKPVLVATSYESESTLQRVYPNINETISELRSLGAYILFEVDATNLEGTLRNCNSQFHRIVWNFPCTAIGSGQDGQNQQMEENKELVRKFVIGASRLLSKDGGEIHMAHKTKPPYNQWKIEQIAMEGWHQQKRNTASEGTAGNNLCYKGRLVLDRCCFPPYRPRKALDKKSFSCHDACIYIFGWDDGAVDSKCNTATADGFASTISEGSVLHYVASKCNTLLSDEGSNETIACVSTELIDCIRSAHLKESASRRPKRGKKNYALGNQFHKKRKESRR